MRSRSVKLEPGREHFIDLSASIVSSTEEIREITAEARNCLYTDESDLDFYESYTYTNCKFECRLKEAEEKIKCTPWYIPKVSKAQVSKEIYLSQGKNSTTCDPWTSREFLKELRQTNDAPCDHCLSDCNHVTYFSKVTSAGFRWRLVKMSGYGECYQMFKYTVI